MFWTTSDDGVGRDGKSAELGAETKAPKSALLEAARPPAPQDRSTRAAIICNSWREAVEYRVILHDGDYILLAFIWLFLAAAANLAGLAWHVGNMLEHPNQ